MKKVLLTLMSLVAMMAASTNLKAQEVTIVLMPGWTWISIPSTDTLDFETALGSFTPAVGDMIKSQWGNASYRADGHWRGQISHFYPGYGYKYYSNRTMPVLVTFNVQQPAPQVVVTTSEPMLITAISAMGGGEVTVSDGTYIIVKGLCWAAHENPTTNDDFYQEAESGVGSFSISMTDLNIGTTYYVRAYAVTPNGTVYGDQKTFTTRDGIPTLTTDSVINITGATATCGGNITDNGGLNVTARGVCWSTIHNPTINDDHSINGSGLGSFTSNISGLTPSTTYYVRAYASTSYSTSYGEEVSFTTQNSSVGLYVDLGLPTGTLWALCNAGAEAPEEYGGYYDEWGIPDLGADWRLPTKEEWQELLNNTTSTWTILNGVNGRLYTASNGNSLFLPAAGYIWSSGSGTMEEVGIRGYYWSSSLILGDDGCQYHKWYFYNGFNYGGFNYLYGDLNYLVSVRAVHRKPCTINVTANPTEGGVVNGGGIYIDGTNCTVSATANEGYVFINWTENDEVVSTEATYSFTLDGNRTFVANFTYVGSGGQTYVDLGLPSGLLWATCNVGADVPEDYGDYFAWGETQPKSTYDWSTYQYCNGSHNTLTKYCYNPEYGYNGFTDNLTILLPEDDAVTVNWGTDWRLPTNEEWQELYQNTTYTWATLNSITGILFTASNGNSLFLPLAGIREGSSLNYLGNVGRYLSSFLGTYRPYGAWLFYFDNVDEVYGYGMWDPNRHHGNSVRAVRSGSQSNTPTGAINGKFTINPAGDQVYFSQGNLQFQPSANLWRFADNQYDMVNTPEDMVSNYYDEGMGCYFNCADVILHYTPTFDGWIDLFGWGTSGWNNGNSYYHPWDSDEACDLYGPHGLYDLSGSYTNADWGIYNPISNGGNQINQWRTLTQAEWTYIFSTRSTASGIRYAKANVSGVNGVVLLPDDWSAATYNLSNTNMYTASFTSNVISDSQWTIIESAGAVFLPAAGYRIGTSVLDIGSCGFYWSASDFSNGSIGSQAYARYVSEWELSGIQECRSWGFSIRLVCNV